MRKLQGEEKGRRRGGNLALFKDVALQREERETYIVEGFVCLLLFCVFQRTGAYSNADGLELGLEERTREGFQRTHGQQEKGHF